MEGILESGVEGKMRKDKAAVRCEGQLTQELERQDKITTNAKPEGSILIDEIQTNNGESIERRCEPDAEYLQDGPVVDNDACVIVAEEDMVVNEEEVVLRDGAGTSSDTRYASLPCSRAGPRRVSRFYDELT